MPGLYVEIFFIQQVEPLVPLRCKDTLAAESSEGNVKPAQAGKQVNKSKGSRTAVQYSSTRLAQVEIGGEGRGSRDSRRRFRSGCVSGGAGSVHRGSRPDYNRRNRQNR